jgi:hypothetical protein
LGCEDVGVEVGTTGRRDEVEAVGFAAGEERDGWEIAEDGYMMEGGAEERGGKGLSVCPFLNWPSGWRYIICAIKDCFYKQMD